MITQSNLDAAFLREHVEFTSHGAEAVADAMLNALTHAHARDDFERVAHLQVALHAEMVRGLETIGAFLLAYSKWNKPGGVMRALFTYRPGDVPAFMEELGAASDPLGLLRFPTPEAMLGQAEVDDAELIKSAYRNQELSKTVADISKMYVSEDLRGAYNKIKHGGMYVRHPEMLKPVEGKVVEGEDAYVMLYRKDNNSVDFASFRVTGDAGLRMAKQYHKNICTIAKRSRTFAGFVAFCLEHELMRQD